MTLKSMFLIAAAAGIGVATAGIATAEAPTEQPSSSAPKPATKASSSSTYFGQITPAQREVIAKLVKDPDAPADVRPAISNASHDIRSFLAFASCRANYLPNFQNRTPEYRTPFNDGGAMTELPSHQRGQSPCLTVEKISDWRRISGDAFAFKVLYRSGDGKETVTKHYKAIEEAQHEWHFEYLKEPEQPNKG